MDFSSQLANLQRTAAHAASQQQQQQQQQGQQQRNPASPADSRRHPSVSASHSSQGRKRQRRNQQGNYSNLTVNSAGRRRHYWNEHALERALATLPHFRMPQTHPPSSTRPTTASSETTASSNKPKHLALLVLSIDDLPYEHIWRAWATASETIHQDNNNLLQISFIGHAKFPHRVKSPWLKQRLLVNPPVMGRGHEFQPPIFHSRRPAWGSIEITRAMLDLLHEGLTIGTATSPLPTNTTTTTSNTTTNTTATTSDRHRERIDQEGDARFSSRRYNILYNTPDEIQQAPPPIPVDKFLFVSETCLPVSTLQEVYDALFTTTTTANGTNSTTTTTPAQDEDCVSWVNARNTPNNGYSKQMQFDKIHPVVPRSCLWKADQWMLLSRPHAMAVMDLDRNLPREHFLWECFLDTRASDEMYFPTALGLLGILPVPPPPNNNNHVQLRRVTYADWSGSARNPASFGGGVADLKRVAEVARREGCLLARKFVLRGGDETTVAAPDGVNAGGNKPPHPSQEGDSNSAQGAPAPGYISVEEWKSVIDEVAKVEKKDSIASPEEVVATLPVA